MISCRSSRDAIDINQPSVLVHEDDITMITDGEELSENNNRNKNARMTARANTEDEIQQNLDQYIIEDEN